MSKQSFFLILCGLYAFGASVSYTQVLEFEKLHRPLNHDVLEIKALSSGIYIHGYHSVDGGRTWRRMHPNGISTINDDYIASDGTVYGAAESGLWKSADGGDTWEKVTTSIAAVKDLLPLSDGSILFVTRDPARFRLYKTTDTFRTMYKTPVESLWTPFECDDGTVLIGSNNLVLRSIDFGETWDTVYTLKDISARTMFRIKNGGVAFNLGGTEVYESYDCGLTWSKFYASNPPPDVYDVVATNDSVFYSAKFQIVYRTTDCGHSWNVVSHPDHSHINDIEYDTEYNAILLGSRNGILASTDDGVSWQLRDDDFMEVSISVQSIDRDFYYGFGNSYFLAHCNPVTGLWVYDNLKKAGVQVEPQIAYSATKKYVPAEDGLYWGYIGDSEWHKFGEIEGSFLQCALSPDGNTIVAMTTNSILYISYDAGLNFYSFTLQNCNNISGLIVDSKGRIFCTQYQALKRINEELGTMQTVKDSIYGPTKILPDGKWLVGRYITADEGQTWQDIYPPAASSKYALNKDNIIFASCEIANSDSTLYYVLRSLDFGHHWSIAGQFYDSGSILDIAIDLDGRLLVSAQYTMYRSLHTTGISESPSIDYLYLSQNYPNPFNPNTTIEYSLPNRAAVTLSVTDTYGRTVKTFELGVLEPGSHRQNLDLSGFPGGMYFYNLRAGNAVQTKKMLLVK